MSKIVVVGAGNIGSVLFGELLNNNPNDLCVMSAIDADKWKDGFSVSNILGEKMYNVENPIVSNDDIYDGDIYYFTLPKNVLFPVLKRYIVNAKENSVFVFIPGTGGVEFFSNEAKKRNIDFVGLQRPPYTARIDAVAKIAYLLSKKKEIFVCSKNNGDISFLEKQLDIKVNNMNNFLDITFTPSNPILHTSRLYGIFAKEDKVFDHNVLFYEEWTDYSSTVLLKCDAELQLIVNAINVELPTTIVPLSIYYESDTPQKMTAKIRSIEAFKKIGSPMVFDESKNGYVIDLTSRYFKEDFEFGLIIIKAFGEILNIETPMIDEILLWYEKISKDKIFIDGKLNRTRFNILPQNFGIESIDEIKRFYLK